MPSGTVVVKAPSGRVRSTSPAGGVSMTRKSLFVAVTTTDAERQSGPPVPQTMAPLKFASLSSSSATANATGFRTFQSAGEKERDATDGANRGSVDHTRSAMFVAGAEARRKETVPVSPSHTFAHAASAATATAWPCGRRTR